MGTVSALAASISLGRTGRRGRARSTIRPMAAPRVLIAEDQVLLREGLARLLEEQGLDAARDVGRWPTPHGPRHTPPMLPRSVAAGAVAVATSLLLAAGASASRGATPE